MNPTISTYLAGALVVVALLAGLAAGWLLRAATSGTSVPADAERHHGPGPATAIATATDVVERERADRLVTALVDIGDRVANVALADRARAAIRAAGWTVVDPVGQPFDADHHRAVDRQVTGESTMHQTVASTERAGYLDPDGRVVRCPEVVVYQYEENR